MLKVDNLPREACTQKTNRRIATFVYYCCLIASDLSSSIENCEQNVFWLTKLCLSDGAAPVWSNFTTSMTCKYIQVIVMNGCCRSFVCGGLCLFEFIQPVLHLYIIKEDTVLCQSKLNGVGGPSS